MSQQKKILNYLQQHDHITPLDAMALFGVMRLASRIDELRQAGHKIETNIDRTKGKPYAKYRLIQSAA